MSNSWVAVGSTVSFSFFFFFLPLVIPPLVPRGCIQRHRDTHTDTNRSLLRVKDRKEIAASISVLALRSPWGSRSYPQRCVLGRGEGGLEAERGFQARKSEDEKKPRQERQIQRSHYFLHPKVSGPL